jgi:hypothetical protein
MRTRLQKSQLLSTTMGERMNQAVVAKIKAVNAVPGQHVLK